MSRTTLGLDETLRSYLHEVSLREPELLRNLREETAALPQGNMQISPEQGQFMTLLVELVGASRAIEVGTFTGYSALCVARALPPDGLLIACDTSEEWTTIAQRYWREAGLADRIDLRLAPALETLDGLLRDGQGGAFDFVFIDADKQNYVNYYERAVELLRSGGLIAVDNALWSGRVADPDERDEETAAIRLVNRRAHEDERVSISLVPIGDGVLLARKR